MTKTPVALVADTAVSEFRERRLDHVEFRYVFLDATYVKVHEGARVVSKAIVVATGVAGDDNRKVLGLSVGDSDDKAFWTAFLRSLRSRGLTGVRLVISDAHEGLRHSIDKVMIGAAWQRCRVHFLRNVLAKVLKGHADMVAAARWPAGPERSLEIAPYASSELPHNNSADAGRHHPRPPVHPRR